MFSSAGEKAVALPALFHLWSSVCAHARCQAPSVCPVGTKAEDSGSHAHQPRSPDARHLWMLPLQGFSWRSSLEIICIYLDVCPVGSHAGRYTSFSFTKYMWAPFPLPFHRSPWLKHLPCCLLSSSGSTLTFWLKTTPENTGLCWSS